MKVIYSIAFITSLVAPVTAKCTIFSSGWSETISVSTKIYTDEFTPEGIVVQSFNGNDDAANVPFSEVELDSGDANNGREYTFRCKGRCQDKCIFKIRRNPTAFDPNTILGGGFSVSDGLKLSCYITMSPLYGEEAAYCLGGSHFATEEELKRGLYRRNLRSETDGELIRDGDLRVVPLLPE